MTDSGFTRNGVPGGWGTNLSRALWYTSKGSGGSAKEGRLKVSEFVEYVGQQSPGLLTEGKFKWRAQAWEVPLPNGTRLGFKPTPTASP